MSPASGPIHPAQAVPATEDAVVALVRDAATAATPLHVLGSGTKRHHGPAVSAGARPVSLRGLDRITAYEPGDMVVGVQAGVRLVDLQRTLAQHGQWLPIDPPYAEATIGGILATASVGPRRLGHGRVKDHLLGMRVVGASGVVTRSGGRVVKNVTGYDLHKLHVGAFGSLGVILEAHFKVQPRPEVSGAVVFGCVDLETAHRLLLEVGRTPLRPVALEALSASAVVTFGALSAGIPPTSVLALAIVGIEGSRPVFDRHLRDLEAFRKRAVSMTVLRGPAAENLWNGFRDAPERRSDDVTVRIGARPHDLPELLGDVAPAGASLAVQAHGVARVFLRRRHGAEITPWVQRWHRTAAARGGYAVVEAAPLDLEGRAELPWSTSTPAPAPAPPLAPALPLAGALPLARAVPLARALKDRWDPAGILNPGRMAP
jgi:glycolate oxidase FAD binding subunit